MKNATRPGIFKWRQTAPELIVCAVRWYLRYSLSLCDVEELFAEHSLAADHTTIWRWVQRYGPELEQRLPRHLKPTNKSWRVCGELLLTARLNNLTICPTQEAPKSSAKPRKRPDLLGGGGQISRICPARTAARSRARVRRLGDGGSKSLERGGAGPRR